MAWPILAAWAGRGRTRLRCRAHGTPNSVIRRSVALALVLVGCAAGPELTHPPTTYATTSSPDGVVVGFLEACGRHDASGALSVLSPVAGAQAARSAAPLWGASTISLTGIAVDNVRPDPFPSKDGQLGFTDITQVTVEATVQFDDNGKAGMTNGRNTWFAYVGRTTERGGWRILSIGGGP